MRTRLLRGQRDHDSLFNDLSEDRINPSCFFAAPNSYPAMACWVELNQDSLRWGWDALGGYIYPYEFTE